MPRSSPLPAPPARLDLDFASPGIQLLAPRAVNVALTAFEENGGILSTGKAIKLGIHPRTLYALRDNARLERMERGLYRLADAKPLSNPDLVTVARKVPRGAVCLISALAFQRMTTQVPHAVYLAIPTNDQAPALQYPPLQLFWYSKAVYESGVIETTLDCAKVRVYSALFD
jgi:predicted transcriptional regulator of viral defense system